MYEKTVEITIKVPVQFSYEPADPEYGYPAQVRDLYWSDEEIAKAVILELYMDELHAELLEHAEAEIQAAKDEAAVDRWEYRQMMAECLDRR
jgi:hypothetical protein